MIYTISTTNNPYEKKITLNWTPTTSNIRATPYVFTTRFFNGTFSMDYTFLVYVYENTTIIKEINHDIFNVFPNPNTGFFNKRIVLDHSQLVYINGKPKIEKNIFLNEGLNEVSFEISLPSGIYFLTNNKSRDGTFIEKIFIK